MLYLLKSYIPYTQFIFIDYLHKHEQILDFEKNGPLMFIQHFSRGYHEQVMGGPLRKNQKFRVRLREFVKFIKVC